MVLNKGGYVIFDVNENDETLYERAKNVVLCGKPILVYDGFDEDNPLIKYCYWADDKRLEQRIIDDVTINYVIITAGGITIEVSEDNSIAISGNIQNHLYKYYVSYKGVDEETNSIDFRIEFYSSIKYTELSTDIIDSYLQDGSSLALEYESNKVVFYCGTFNNTLSFNDGNKSYNINTLQDIQFYIKQIF